MSTNYELISFRTPDELAVAAAKGWLDAIDTANRMKASQDVALSGGRITQKFFASVVEQSKSRKTSFDRVQFFWADERCVPPSDPESNFKLANDLLFRPLKISEKQIHRLRGEDAPDAAAKSAEAEIRSAVGTNANNQPVLDIIFLGLGEDGHVASLFPGEAEKWISDKAAFRAIENSPKPPPNRISIGYQTIAAARQVWMFASGSGKEKALRDSLAQDGKTSFGRVLRLRGNTKILTDIVI
jgi:6-phosphogluconolactonase